MSAVRTFHDGIRCRTAGSRLPGWPRVVPVHAVPPARPFIRLGPPPVPADPPTSTLRSTARGGAGVDAALRRQFHDRLDVVRRRRSVPPLVTAALAAVDHDGPPGPHLHGNRAHRPCAVSRPITGVDVHMPGPQAARAVVGVAVAVHRRPAGKALEVLGGTGETTGHHPTVRDGRTDGRTSKGQH